MCVALLLRVKVCQTNPANTCTTMHTVHIITSGNLFNRCCTLGATFVHPWIFTKPFLKLLFTVFSSLIHGTGQTIVVLIMTLGAEVDATVTADKSFSIIWHNINHVTVWCWATTYSMPVCHHVAFYGCCSKLLTGDICSLEEIYTVLPYKWVRAFSTL